MPRARFKPLSLRVIMLYIFLGVLLVSELIFASFAAYLIFSRITASEMNLLDRSIIIYWQEYNRFFNEEEGILRTMATGPRMFSSLADSTATVRTEFPSLGDTAFRLLIDRNGTLAAGDFAITGGGQALVSLLAPAWEQGKNFHSWELLSMKDCRELLPPSLARRAEIDWTPEGAMQPQEFPSVLVQIVAVPIFDQERLLGCLAGVRIINNDEKVNARYTGLVPNSFYSIVVNGIRIATNLHMDELDNLVGTPAAPEVPIESSAIRYTGQSHMSSQKLHLIVADPILDSKKRVIGFLVVGIPADTVAGIKMDILLLLFLSLLLCLGASTLIILRMARLVTRPITNLSNLARDISQQKVITRAHLLRLKEQTPSFIIENRQLFQGFLRMAVMLFQKNLELRQINASLENSVQERTLALQNAVGELRSLSAKKSQVIANLSHELRTPLTSVIGFSEMLADELYGRLNQTQKEYVDIILLSAKHLLELINDLLDMNSIERGKLELYRQQVYMDDLIRSVVATVQIQADNKDLNLSQKSEELLLTLDPLRMRQVLYNIITNAIKFTNPGGKIEILASREEDQVLISVRDTGIGVSDEDQEHIFDEFYQCADLYKRKFEGIGVGLSLSQKLIAMHGGSIEFISKLGVGTTVRIRLPLDTNNLRPEVQSDG